MVSTVVRDLNGMVPDVDPTPPPSSSCTKPLTLVYDEMRMNSNPVVHPHLGGRTGSRGRRRRSAENGRNVGARRSRASCVGLDLSTCDLLDVLHSPRNGRSIEGRARCSSRRTRPRFLARTQTSLKFCPNLRPEKIIPHLLRYRPRASTRQPFLHPCPSTARSYPWWGLDGQIVADFRNPSPRYIHS